MRRRFVLAISACCATCSGEPMPVSKPSSQPKTMLDTPLDIPVSDVRKSGTFSPPAILEQIKVERERLEQYTREQHARLSKLRELMLAEKTAAEKELAARKEELDRQAELLKNGQQSSAEAAEPQTRAELQAALDQLTAERDAIVAEVQQLQELIKQLEKDKSAQAAE